MNISVEHLPECKARLSVTIPADIVRRTRQQVVSAFAKEAKIPGFRRGKIPSTVIEKRYSDSIDSELKERLQKAAVNEARVNESIRILGISQVEREQLETDGSCLMALEVVTEPEVEIPDYQSIPVEVPKIEITDAEVDQTIEQFRKKNSYKVSTGEPAKDGQMLEITYSGKIDDQALEEKDLGIFASGEKMNYPVGEETPYDFIPGLGKAGIGLSVGDNLTYTADFPEDSQIENLAGKTVVYDITVSDVFEMREMDLDADFIQSTGHETMEEFRIWVRNQLVSNAEKTRENMIDNQIVEFLTKDSSFELPQHLVFSATQSGVSDMVMRGYQQGMSEEMISEHQGEIIQNAEKRAKSTITAHYVLLKVAELENLSVSDKDVYQRIAQVAFEQNRPIKKVLQEVRGHLNKLREDLLIGKTVLHLRQNVVVTEVTHPAPSEDGQSIEPALSGSAEAASTEPATETSVE